MNAFLRFNRGILAMPLHWRAWLLVLVSANLFVPLFFLEHAAARATLAALLGSMLLMTAITARFGFSRILGLGHIFWVPLLGYLWTRLPHVPAHDAFGLWLRAVLALNATSLVIDAVDVARFLAGDRDETVPGVGESAGALRG